MSGPPPKNPQLKTGSSRRSTRAILPPDLRPIIGTPPIAPHPQKEKWLPLTLAFWNDVWTSPMASQFTQSDLHGLFRMAVLTQAFLNTPTVVISAELRQLSMSYGLSPVDRRRLEWTIAKAEDATAETEVRRTRRARVVNPNSKDPREVLND